MEFVLIRAGKTGALDADFESSANVVLDPQGSLPQQSKISKGQVNKLFWSAEQIGPTNKAQHIRVILFIAFRVVCNSIQDEALLKLRLSSRLTIPMVQTLKRTCCKDSPSKDCLCTPNLQVQDVTPAIPLCSWLRSCSKSSGRAVTTCWWKLGLQFLHLHQTSSMLSQR